MKSNVRPFDIQRMAASIARSHGGHGTIVITWGPKGICVGVKNLTPNEMRQALCVAVNYSFAVEETSSSSDVD